MAAKKEAFRLPEGGLIVRVPPGSRLPIKLALVTPFATFEPGDNHLRFDREVNSQGFFSPGAGVTREEGAIIQAVVGFAPPP